MKMRIFKGDETKQICGVTGKPAAPEMFYFEPPDYTGDVLWSVPSDTLEEAERLAAKAETGAEPPCDCDRTGINGTHEDHCAVVVA